MIAQKSALKLDYFSVLQAHYNFSQPKKKPKNIIKLFQSYEINIDFAHHFDEAGLIRVFVKIGINQAKKILPGYKLLVEGVGMFHFSENKISDKEKDNLKFYSTVSIVIGYLRNSLSDLTSSAPFGPYLLPSIDLNDLFLQKSLESTGEQDEIAEK